MCHSTLPGRRRWGDASCSSVDNLSQVVIFMLHIQYIQYMCVRVCVCYIADSWPQWLMLKSSCKPHAVAPRGRGSLGRLLRKLSKMPTTLCVWWGGGGEKNNNFNFSRAFFDNVGNNLQVDKHFSLSPQPLPSPAPAPAPTQRLAVSLTIYLSNRSSGCWDNALNVDMDRQSSSARLSQRDN